MKKLVLLLALMPALLPALVAAQTNNPPVKPELTEVWTPVPPKVTPGDSAGQPPSDAVVLFNGRDLNNWEGVNGGKADWVVGKDAFIIAPKSGSIQTKEKFGDVQLHIEWMVPVLPPARKGQDRGNSGIFLQNLYEVQVLDTLDNPTYVNGQAGSIYKQYAPLVNAQKPAPAWQSYDIIYMAPRFYGDGTLAEPARMTIFLNGILVQNNVPLRGPTEYRGIPLYKPHGEAPLMLQAHNNEVHYRNVWLRKL
jgi:hypothetical protein